MVGAFQQRPAHVLAAGLVVLAKLNGEVVQRIVVADEEVHGRLRGGAVGTAGGNASAMDNDGGEGSLEALRLVARIGGASGPSGEPEAVVVDGAVAPPMRATKRSASSEPSPP